VRVTSGCFHREHSPHAFALIDSQLVSVPPGAGFDFVEHERAQIEALLDGAIQHLAREATDKGK
jgi:hypothetical protein